jgi:hypothetical protein
VPALRLGPEAITAIACGALGVAAIQLAGLGMRYAGTGLAIQYAREEFPVDAVAFLAREGAHGNWAVQFEWGGSAMPHLGPAIRVFIDGRYEAAYPPTVLDDYFAFVDGSAEWARVLDAYPTDGVLLERTATVVPLLDARPDLVRVYSDGTAVAYLRRTPTNAVLLERLTAMAHHEGPDLVRPTVFP